MANIVFASNNIAHFSGAVSGSVANTFDSSRVPYTLALSNYQLVHSPEFIPVVGDVTWFHFRTYPVSTGFSLPTGASGIMFQAYDAAGNLLLKFARKNSSNAFELVTTLYNGTTTSILNNPIPLTEARVNSIDIKLTINTVNISVDIYVNRTLNGTITFGSNPNALTAPVRFSLGAAFVTALSSIQHYSEILVADGDTRNARLNALRPFGTGAFSDWEGSLATLADDDTTTGITTTEPATRHTMVLSPYSGAANISNFVAASMTTRGENSPTKIKHTVRLGGINYDSADIPLGNPIQYSITDFKLNPATSLAWVGSDLSSIESGILSVA